MLAATCCLPLLEIGAAGWRGWSQLIVYPDAFRVQRTHTDAAGVMHAWDDTLIGEAWEHGPLIVSWADVQADLDDPQAGFNVIVHEMAHKLDALDGALDGSQPLPRAAQRTWARDFQHAYDLFLPTRRCRRRHRDRPICRRSTGRILRGGQRISLLRTAPACTCDAAGCCTLGTFLRTLAVCGVSAALSVLRHWTAWLSLQRG